MGVSERGFVFADATLKNSKIISKFFNNCFSKNENKFIIFFGKKIIYLGSSLDDQTLGIL